MCMHHFTAVVKYKDLKFVLEYIWARTSSLKGSDQAKFAYSNPRIWHWQFHLLWTISIHYFDRDANRSSRQTRQASLPLSDCDQVTVVPSAVVPSIRPGPRMGDVDNHWNVQAWSHSTQRSGEDEDDEDEEQMGDVSLHVFFRKGFKVELSLCSYMIVYITFITTRNCKSITSITNDNFLLYLSISITPLRGISGNFGPVNQATLKVIAKSHSKVNSAVTDQQDWCQTRLEVTWSLFSGKR